MIAIYYNDQRRGSVLKRIIAAIILLAVTASLIVAMYFSNVRFEDIPSYEDLIIPYTPGQSTYVEYLYTYKIHHDDESIPDMDSFPPWIVREKLGAIASEIRTANFAVVSGQKTEETRKYFKPKAKKLLLDVSEVMVMYRFNVVLVGIEGLTNEKIHTFKQIFPDAHYVVFADMPNNATEW